MKVYCISELPANIGLCLKDIIYTKKDKVEFELLEA